MASRKKGRGVVWARRTVQTLCVLAFIYLIHVTDYSPGNQPGGPGEFFFQIDPLVLVTTWLSSGVVYPALLLSLITLGITFLFGRLFCGWICPMGAIHNLFSALRDTKRSIKRQTERWSPYQRWKYFGLAVLLAAGIGGFHILGWFDPLCFLERGISLSLYPAFNEMTVSLFTWLYNRDPMGVTAVSEPIYSFLRDHILLFKQTHYQLAGTIGLLFVIALVLNFYRNRFWCRYICPLGALLGWAGKNTLLQLKNDPEKCGGCNLCITDCQGAADPFTQDGWKPSECFYCWNCQEACPSDAITFGLEFPDKKFVTWLKAFFKPGKEQSLNLGRRKVLASAGAGMLTGVSFAAQPIRTGASYSPTLVRPPGALAEWEFQDRCIRCGACMKICPTNMLHPTFLEAGIGGMWSPISDFKIGYCQFECTLCGQICPTGAIQELPVEEKKKVKMGLAFFDPERCIPYAWQRDCIVCEEHCPTSPKAIWFESVDVLQRDGTPLTVKRPHVDPEKCIGCGICENKCPVMDKRGIRVSSVGESRHPGNQMILEADSGYY